MQLKLISFYFLFCLSISAQEMIQVQGGSFVFNKKKVNISNFQMSKYEVMQSVYFGESCQGFRWMPAS